MNYNNLPPFSDTLEDKRLTEADVEPPMVSIIVTNYNYGHYIIDTLRSVVRQSYSHWECIIVDDCSSDDSRKKIRSFIEDPSSPSDKFQLIERRQNGGQMVAFMQGLNVSKGTFVMMLDSDDLLLDDFLITHIQYHLRNYPVAFTSSNQYQINGNGNVISGDHGFIYVEKNSCYWWCWFFRIMLM